jgi:RNA polymerase sigma-70 factor (ECF subfamily)
MKSQPGYPSEQADENQLLQQAQEGDAEAFGVLYARYLDPIYRYVYYRVDGAETAEDLTEEVFVRAWEALPGYEITKYPFKSWLYRIAHNRVIDHRRKRRPAAIDDEVLQRIPGASTPPEQMVVDGQNAEALQEAVQQLAEEEQQVVILRFVEGLSHREVAEIIGKSEEASRVIQYRAIQRLQRVLSDRGRSQ